MDTEGRGAVSHVEFEAGLRKMGINVSKDDVHTVIQHHDKEHTGDHIP